MSDSTIKLSVNERYFDVFPQIDQSKLPEAIRSYQDEQMIRESIENDPNTYQMFMDMSMFAREQFIEFCMGNRGLQITYDPFFKKIFNKERLGSLISNILGQQATVVEILPRDVYKTSAEGSMMIMDVIVMLADGSIVDVEIQKISHKFPIHRAICYASDMLMRQYDILKSEMKKKFDYSNLRPVYVIVLFESSLKKFDDFPNNYVHTSLPNIHFDTGLVEENLMKFVFVSLDIFKKMQHNNISKLEAWMYFLSSDKPEDICKVINKYPEFIKAYQEINEFRKNPKELLTMMSEAINIMDQNAFKSMIEEMKEEITDASQKLADVSQKLANTSEELADAKNLIRNKDADIARLKAIIERNGLTEE